MPSLAEKLSTIVGHVFEKQDLPADLGRVQVSDRPDLAQFQCNGAMAAAKIAKTNPREIAQKIVDALAQEEVIEKVDIAGPGFINIHVQDNMLQNYLGDMKKDDRLGVAVTGSGTAIVDYAGINVAKAMHVGHLRPTIIGDCIKHILRYAGYDTLGDIHMGDWGLPMGQIISEFEIRHPDWVYFDPDFTGPYPKEAPFDFTQLEEIYPEASAACKEDEHRLEKARQATADLQDGRPGYRALWEHFMTLSKADMKENFDSLGVQFEIWKGEADVHDFIETVGDDLKSRGIAEESKGAFIIPVAKEDDNKEMPPLIYYKSDGAVTYGTTDICTIYDRVKLYPDLTKVIYAVDARQSLHFEQVFRAVEKAGYGEDIEFTHIGHGTLNGPGGKPFKTRDGGVMRFADMVSAANQKAMERLQEADLATDMSAEEKQEIARAVAIAAIKFAELSNQPHNDYIFDLEKIVSFEGKTGPYLLYQGVRTQSLLKKAKDLHVTINDDTMIQIDDADRPLALLLTELPDHFDLSLKHYAPHYLCEHAYKLAQAFSSFYNACHILSEEDDTLKQSRLALCQLTLNQLKMILSLLGISIPERM